MTDQKEFISHKDGYKGYVEWHLKHLANVAGELSEWEMEFVISVEDQYKSRGWLSEKQIKVLEEIYKRH